ncbi:endo-1,4-beta-xylanase [Roseomonas sp. CCTCC AB2023176]|uniref:endo-1,4-beta-xylanase n=1 Tax=Roseomonas sp. CCTCC AB2023176 TaxID=3342640 RepID=UPI0035DCE5CE
MRAGRRALLAAAGASVAGCGARAQPGDAARNPPPGLWQIARERGCTFGAAVQADLLASDPLYAQAYEREAGLLVPEYEGKWAAVQPVEGQFDFRGLDAVVQWGRARGRATRGHCLVWHNAMPDWLTSALGEGRGRAEALLEAHIAAVLTQTRAVIRDWDVVNEAVANPPGSDVPQTTPGEMRDTPWLRALGPTYVDTAFRIARRVDPTLRLTLNDYGVEEDTPAAEEKRRRLLALVRRLIRARVPVDAVGLQAHLQMDKPFNPSLFGTFVRALRAEGVAVLVTELDIREGRQIEDDYPRRDRLVAERAHAFVSAAIDAGVRSFITWGLVDKYSWTVTDKDVRRGDDRHHRGLPLDWEYNRKQMWRAMARAFRGEAPDPDGWFR